MKSASHLLHPLRIQALPNPWEKVERAEALSTSIKSSDLRGGFGFPPKAELAR
jgi:hypothetical protein